MMEFELLRSFVAVAECGGFHRAADQLNLTQSTVSQQIKRLELETNRPLFRRTTRTVALTDDGEMLLGEPAQIAATIRRRVKRELGLPISVGVARTKPLAKIASQVAKPDGLVVVDPEAELDFLHPLPVDLMWGVGPATKARLADMGVVTIGQLAEIPGWTLSSVLGSAAGEKLAAFSWNRDPREIKAHRRAHSAGAQLALGRKTAEENVFRPALLQLADRVATRL